MECTGCLYIFFRRKEMRQCKLSFALGVLVLWFGGVAELFASEITPFYFGATYDALTDQEQNDTWQELIKYKLWGTGLSGDPYGVAFIGQDVQITDEVGYSGSATAGLEMRNIMHSIGGPLAFAGDFKNADGQDTIMTGPSYFGGNFNIGSNAVSSDNVALHGNFCVKGDKSTMTKGLAKGGGKLDCTADNIPALDSTLDVPRVDHSTITYDLEVESFTFSDKANYIDIPSGSGQFYNIHVKGDMLLDNNNDYLFIRMSGNRYVRIFIDGNLTVRSTLHNIVILNVTDGSWNETTEQWEGGTLDTTLNKNYGGNLLFYTPNDIAFPAENCTIQGTYISGGTISFQQHYNFAGQLLAKKVSINAEFKAGDFRYVPFSPPVINMAVGSMAYEDNEARGDTVKLELSKDPPTRVTFDYCFSLKPASACNGYMDDPACKFANVNDVLESNYTEIPVCGRDTGHAAFPQFSRDLEKPIVFHAKDDMLEEADESVIVKIFNLTAAITPDGDRNADSSYSMDYVIVDNDKRPISHDTSVTVMMNETLPITAFPAYENDGVTVLDKYGVIVKTLPASGTLTYNGVPVAAGDFIKFPGSLNYTPAHDEYGSPYTTFEFVVANVHNPDISDTARTMTINVVRFQYTINENASVDTLVGIIDELRISDIQSCAIVSGDTGTTFRFDTTRIYLNGVLDFETQSSYVFFVKCANSTTEDSTAVQILIVDDNDPPSVTDTTMQVAENMPVGTTVGTMLYYDQDGTNSGFCENSFSLVGGDSSLFKIDAQTGVITTRAVFDYEALPDSQKYYTVKVQIADTDGNKSVAEVKIEIVNVVETSKITVTHAESGNGSYSESNPDLPIKINDKTLTLSWMGDTIPQPDTTLTDLHEGYNVVTLTYYDKTKDTPAVKDVTIFVCTKTPEVQVSTAVDKLPDANIYTITEEPAEGDTSFYVNKKLNDIAVKIKEPILDSTYTDSTCKYKEHSVNIAAVMFDTMAVPQATFKTVEKIASEKLVLNETPAGTVKYVPYNDSLVLVSYREIVGSDTVTVSYVTNAKGDVVDEQIKVAYQTKIDGQVVEISYTADAFTGAPVESEAGAIYTVSYRFTDRNGETVMVGYALDTKGKVVKDADGNVGYEVTYTYANEFGNISSQSIYIVVDVIPPKVEILSPEENEIFYANYVDVKWTVDRNDGKGPVVMDTLTEQGLVKGGNAIVRFYRDKAGNVASDTVKVIMKNSKDLDISVVTPVTIVTREKTEEYYAANEPKEGQTFSVTIYNSKADKEIETLRGGEFETEEGSGGEPYPGLEGHLGPTLAIDTKLSTIRPTLGLATLDDLVGKDGLVNYDGIDSENGDKHTVEEYVREHCTAEFQENMGSDISRASLYHTTMKVKIWVYTTLGNFVDYFSFEQELDNPDYTNDAGVMTLYFEQKPDKDGYVRTANGRQYATGAYLYKTDVSVRSELQCDTPPVERDKESNRKGYVRKVRDDLLKPFGYKRPNRK